jgi:hypothetical protein
VNTPLLANGTYDLPLPQISRRRLVVIELLCSVAPPLVLFSGFAFGRWVGLLLFLIPLLIGAICHTRLAMSIQNIAQVNPARLDERQRAARDRAFVLSLRYLGWVLGLACVYAMIAGITDWWLPEKKYFGFALWSFMMLAFSLPTAVAAWNEPDPIED